MPLLSTRGGGSARGYGLNNGGFPGIIATGGVITEQGDYYLHTFNSTDTFQITKGSSKYPTFDWFLMGGGGAGGGGQVHGPEGNGGAAGISKNANAVTGNITSYTITIGSGGNATGNGAQQGYAGNAGNSSNAFGETATAGNGGQGVPQNGQNGGNNALYSGVSGQGRYNPGGAGAGAGGNANAGGFGGIGIQTPLANGAQTYFGGGGGTRPTGGVWSQGGGGNWQALPGIANTGSGGGGGYSWGGGGAGAAGVCFIRYQVK
jgi:hypothetical protein